MGLKVIGAFVIALLYLDGCSFPTISHIRYSTETHKNVRFKSWVHFVDTPPADATLIAVIEVKQRPSFKDVRIGELANQLQERALFLGANAICDVQWEHFGRNGGLALTGKAYRSETLLREDYLEYRGKTKP